MSYPYVASYVSAGTARGPRRAVVWHFAEGGGTVRHLSRQNPNGVSVHFVVEYTGRIVQMLRLTQMHTSIRSSDIRDSDDKPYDWRGTDIVYGRTAAKAVLGEWADIHRSLGPNHASIAVEVEGFANRDGHPNDKQKDAIARLWADLSARYPGIRSLGHRDFADYKACPGRQFPWEEVGGHGPAIAEDEEHMDIYSVPGRWQAQFKPGALATRRPGDAGTAPLVEGKWYDLVGQSAEDHPGHFLLDGGGAGRMAWAAAIDIAQKRDLTATIANTPRTFPVVLRIGDEEITTSVNLP